MLDKIKKYSGYIYTGIVAVLGILVLVFRSKAKTEEGKAINAEFNAKNDVLKDKQEEVDKRIEKLKKEIKDTKDKKVEVPDLSPEDSVKYWEKNK